MSNTKSYVSLTKEKLNRLIGNVTVESLFSGYGFYKDNHMFGIAQSGVFYLRAEGRLAAFLEREGAMTCSNRKGNNALSLSHYYCLPIEITQNDKLYKSILRHSIEQVQQSKLEFQLSQKTRLKDLFNLELKHERLLSKVNITSVRQLREVGAEMAYIRMKKIGLPITLGFYWSLVAALKNIPVSLLTAEQKKQALEKLNLCLRKEGMRAEKG